MQTTEIVGNHLQQIFAFLLHLLLFRSYHIQSVWNDFHLQFLARHQRVSVEMHHSVVCPVNLDFLGTHRLYPAVLVDGLVEQLERKTRYIQHRKWLHNRDIHQPIGKRSLRSDVGIVTILRSISASYHPCLVFHRTFLVFNFIRFRLVSQALMKRVLQISQQPTLARIGKLQADKGIKAHATRTEERYIVDFSVVDAQPVSLIDDIDGRFRLHRDTKMPGQSVARATGDDSQSRFGMYQCTGYLVDSPVTTDGYHHIHLILYSRSCNLGGMSGILRSYNRIIIDRPVHPFVDPFQDGLLALCPRNGIHHKNDSFLLGHTLIIGCVF